MPEETLSEFERRVISHLSIPRNVEDVAYQLRLDNGIANPIDDKEVYETLEDFRARGWVVNFGEQTDMAKLAAKVEKSKAHTMPDEKAAIFARRLSADPHRWRVTGDLWMFTDDGIEASEASTQGNVSPAMTTSQLRTAIDGEWARTVKDAPFTGSVHDDTGGHLADGWEGTLANALLAEEFSHWADAVLAEHERVWGKNEADALRKGLPVAGGSQYSDAQEILFLDAENQKTTYTVAAPWYMALIRTTAVTDADTGSTIVEPTYTGYARKSVAAADMNAGAGASGSVTNANAIVFAACTAGTDTIIGFCNCVALTVGVMRKFGTCSSTVVSNTQTPAQFAAGAYTTTLA